MESVAVDLLAHEFNADESMTDYFVRSRGGKGYLQSPNSKRKFVKWFVDEQLYQAASGESDIITSDGMANIIRICASPFAFSENFVWGSPSSDISQVSLECLIKENAKDFLFAQLRKSEDLAASDMICRVYMNHFDADFNNLSTHGQQFLQYLEENAAASEATD
jgi:hypothetical protein